MRRLYLAGPMRGYPRWNFDAFETATADLRRLGYDVVSPHEVDLGLGFDPDASPASFTRADWHAAMRRDIEILLTVEGIALLDGWSRSEGANIEVAVGRGLGLVIQSVRDWQTCATLADAFERRSA